jgi:hypothetical protein
MMKVWTMFSKMRGARLHDRLRRMRPEKERGGWSSYGQRCALGDDGELDSL